MPLTDRQRTLAIEIDTRLNQLACDIVIGPAAGSLPAIRVSFADVGRMLCALASPALTNLTDFIESRLAGLDHDLLAPFHQAVCQTWDDWYAPFEGNGGHDEAGVHVARKTDGFDLDAMADIPVAPHTVVVGTARSPVDEDADLAVLASDPEISAMFVAEALDHLGTIEATLLELEASPQDKRLLDDVFRPFHTIKGNAGALGVVAVQEFAHKVENLLDLARGSRLRIGPAEFDIVLESVDVLTTMIGELPSRVAGQAASDTAGVRAALAAQIDRAISRSARDGAFDAGAVGPAGVVDLSPATGSPVIAAAAAEDARRLESWQRKTDGTGQSSVKVDTKKLDSLVDMVGELVIAQTLIYEDPAIKQLLDERLARNLAQVRRITTDLQRNAMAMRLVPIKATFQKMARLVRDLSKKSNKTIELSLAGEDTELDRKVVEEINDPLMHMIRNSVDHGIESAEGRSRAGKRPEGQLSLSAAHQGGTIVISIADDGGGLNTGKILRKAVERGLVSPGDSLSSGEIHQLIFKPGFSTADQVTEISGRGVGMDVVRRNIDALRGRIDIQSTPGQGTTFLIKLPLTLAILDGLTLTTGGQRFVLPIFSVRESLRPSSQQVHDVQGAPRMIQVREQLMPLIWLSSVFGIENARSDATEATVVVIEDDSRCVGLVVDELVGKQQVVIKSLGETFADVRGVAGGAILGDGRVGLIIDAGGVIDLLHAPAQAA